MRYSWRIVMWKNMRHYRICMCVAFYWIRIMRRRGHVMTLVYIFECIEPKHKNNSIKQQRSLSSIPSTQTYACACGVSGRFSSTIRVGFLLFEKSSHQIDVKRHFIHTQPTTHSRNSSNVQIKEKIMIIVCIYYDKNTMCKQIILI